MDGNDPTIELTEDDLYASAVYVRTNGLLSMIETFSEERELSLGSNGFVCVDTVVGGILYRLSYFPVGEVDLERFLLIIRTTVADGDSGEHPDRMMICDSFNSASVLGFAVYHPMDGEVEYRFSMMEQGGLSDESYFRSLFEMLQHSITELTQIL